VFAGLPGLVAGVAVAVWSVFRAPAPRTLLRLSVVAMVLAPVAWVVGNLSRWGEVSPQLVLANPAPSVLVVLSLVLLVVGSWRDAGPDDDPAPRDADPAPPVAGSASG
jgi:arabinofuranan 3-O-arabinosyltransferase